MMNFKLVTLGADPEFFISYGGRYFPPFEFTSGNKKHPEEIKDFPGYSILLDNMTLEGNIPPATSKQGFIDNMNTLMSIMTKRLELKKGFKLEHESAVKFLPRFLKNSQAMEIGCAPDKSAFLNENKETRALRLQEKMQTPYRAAGFHIHIGYETNMQQHYTSHINKMMAILFEAFVVIPFEKTIKDDTDNSFRKTLYGNGEFFGYYRNKSYGLECRGLGSYFTRPEYVNQIWDRVELMFKYLNSTTCALNYLNNITSKPYKSIKSLEDILTYHNSSFKELQKLKTRKIYA